VAVLRAVVAFFFFLTAVAIIYFIIIDATLIPAINQQSECNLVLVFLKNAYQN
jgi:hypothetical protein